LFLPCSLIFVVVVVVVVVVIVVCIYVLVLEYLKHESCYIYRNSDFEILFHVNVCFHVVYCVFVGVHFVGVVFLLIRLCSCYIKQI
jgi:hypothetical protein